MCPMYAVAYAPMMPLTVLKTTNRGMMVTKPIILGSIKNDAEFTPIISSASICSVVRIVPNSEAIFEPTLPDKIKHMMLDENSSNMISRVT